MICGRGPVAATLGLFNDAAIHLYYQYCIHYRCRLVFIICMCRPVNIHRHGLYYALRVQLCVFRQMGMHTYAHQASPAFIHSFKNSLAVKQCFLTIKYSSILKVMGLYTMSGSRTYVFAVAYGVCRCIDLKVGYNLPISFNQPFTLKQDFVLEAWIILCLNL